jgi:hypothetical protein
MSERDFVASTDDRRIVAHVIRVKWQKHRRARVWQGGLALQLDGEGGEGEVVFRHEGGGE